MKQANSFSVSHPLIKVSINNFIIMIRTSCPSLSQSMTNHHAMPFVLHVTPTLPRMSTGSLELSRTGLTLSPVKMPPTGPRLSKMESNFIFSSCWRAEKVDAGVKRDIGAPWRSMITNKWSVKQLSRFKLF